MPAPPYAIWPTTRSLLRDICGLPGSKGESVSLQAKPACTGDATVATHWMPFTTTMAMYVAACRHQSSLKDMRPSFKKGVVQELPADASAMTAVKATTKCRCNENYQRGEIHDRQQHLRAKGKGAVRRLPVSEQQGQHEHITM